MQNELEFNIDRLVNDRIARIVKLMTMQSLAIVLLTIACMALGLSSFLFRFIRGEYIELLGWMISFFTLLSAASIFSFDRLRRKGNIYYEEVSHLMQNEIRYKSGEMFSNDLHRDGEPYSFSDSKLSTASVRVALKEFTNASQLPLMPGQYGPAVYLGVCVLMVILFFANLASYSRTL
jgi:hypothetical protein